MTVRSVSEQPEIVLVNWGVMQDFSGYRLVGMHITPRGSQSGRVSSAIVEFDDHAMTVRTESGRLYHLSGSPNEKVSAALIRAHIRRWGLTVTDVAMAEPREVALALAPKPRGGLN